jgi:hypothetical protein
MIMSLSCWIRMCSLLGLVCLAGARHGPPFRVAPLTDPDVQSYRIRHLLRVSDIEA